MVVEFDDAVLEEVEREELSEGRGVSPTPEALRFQGKNVEDPDGYDCVRRGVMRESFDGSLYGEDYLVLQAGDAVYQQKVHPSGWSEGSCDREGGWLQGSFPTGYFEAHESYDEREASGASPSGRLEASHDRRAAMIDQAEGDGLRSFLDRFFLGAPRPGDGLPIVEKMKKCKATLRAADSGFNRLRGNRSWTSSRPARSAAGAGAPPQPSESTVRRGRPLPGSTPSIADKRGREAH